MRDPVVDDVDFEPIDALLEEVVRGEVVQVRRRSGWLAAALLLLGAAAVGGVWWMQHALRQQAATPPVPAPQDPQPDRRAPRSLDELRAALQDLRSVQARALHIVEWVPATDTVTMASDPAATAMLPAAELAAFRDDLLASTAAHTFFDDGHDGARLRRAPPLEIAIDAGDRSFTFRVAATASTFWLADGFGPTVATHELAERLRGLLEQALGNGRRARGEAQNLDELRALPADARSVTCPTLDAEHVRGELSRFTQLERLTFVSAGITQTPTGDAIGALPRTLRELSIQGTGLTAADIRQLAALPLLAAVTLEDGCPPDAIAALAAFGPRLRRLVIAWRSIDAGPVRVRMEEPQQVDIHFPNDIVEPVVTWRSLAGAMAGGLALDDFAIEGDRGALDGAEVLAQAGALRVLRLSLRGTVREVDIDWLPGVRPLRELSLRDSRIDDDVVSLLGRLTQLSALDLTNTSITADAVATLRKALPDCAITARPGVIVAPPGAVTVRKG